MATHQVQSMPGGGIKQSSMWSLKRPTSYTKSGVQSSKRLNPERVALPAVRDGKRFSGLAGPVDGDGVSEGVTK
ncbi:hypothetical protein NL676_018249 [Syzygium grande]|nr:hypothetical protein NL676_018249 [Syzygium grande]